MKKALLISGLILFMISANSQTTYKLYAGRGYTEIIYVFDPITCDTIKIINGAGGYRMAPCPLYNKLYSTGGGDSIYVIDVINDSLIKSIDPSDGTNNTNELEAIVLSPDQTKLYVADESTDALFVLDTSNDSIINATTLSAAYEIENMVISPDGQYLYAADNDDVLKINTTTLTIDATIAVLGDSHGIEISDDGQTLYAHASVGVVVIDVTTFNITDTIASPGYFVKLNIANTRLLTVDESNYLDVTELSNGIITTVPLPSGSARGIIAHPNDSIYYVATSQGIYQVSADSLAVIDNSASISFQSVNMVEITTTGIDPIKLDYEVLRAFPNPFQSSVTIEVDLSISDNTYISILDVSGRAVNSINPNSYDQSSNTITIDLSGLKNGIYFCRIINKGKTQIVKIIKG